MVCQRFWKGSKTPLWNDEKRYKVKLERDTTKSIWEVEGKIYDRASLSNTRLG